MEIKFVANLAEKNETESVKLEKSKGYAITSLSINQDNNSTQVAVRDTDRLETLSNLMQKLVKEKKEPGLDLRIINLERETVIPFPPKSTKWTSPTKTYLLQYNNKKRWNSWILWLHATLEKFDFTWKNWAIEFKY